MNKHTATADVFITAFRALPKIQREAVISGLLEDRRIAGLVDRGRYIGYSSHRRCKKS